MKIKPILFSTLLLVASVVVAYAVVSYDNGRNITAKASQISTTRSGAIALKGQAQVTTVDKVAKTSFDATAKNINVRLFSVNGSKDKTQGLGAVKSATMYGPVKIVYVRPAEGGAIEKITATADNATYDGATNTAHLTGNVIVLDDNPVQYEVPLKMVGQTATINLNPNLGPEDNWINFDGGVTIEGAAKSKAKESK